MDPITQAFIQGAAGAAGGGTYVEDVFSNWTYRGNGAAKNEPNGIDLADKGGLVWIKDCDQANNHVLFDTERGTTKMLRLGGTSAAQEVVGNPEVFSSFDSNGYTHGYWSGTGFTNLKYASWTWAKQEGFFDIVKWTGNGVSGRQIPHNLGSVPGFVMTKALDNGDGWRTLHSYDFSKVLYISGQNAEGSAYQSFVDPVCNATHLIVSADGSINASGQEYIAYIFAGGPSPASEATSTVLDGVNDSVAVPTSSDFDFGNGDFTIECWVKTPSSGDASIINISNSGAASNSSWIFYRQAGKLYFYWTTGTGWTGSCTGQGDMLRIDDNSWHHIAVTRTGGYFRTYVDGMLDGTHNIGTTAIATSTRDLEIGTQNGNFFFDGSISNVRILKGTALYSTQGFKPSTEPLTNITNTKLLCCQGSTTTSATVIPSGTMTQYGEASVSTNSPFLDPESYKFGKEGDQNLIKCGTYTGDSTNAPDIYLGWEPQFLMIKSYTTTGSGYNWSMYDNIRGLVTGRNTTNGAEKYLYPNLANTEASADRINMTPTGFRPTTGAGALTNATGSGYIYIAIRRPDPLVGKPPIVGTDVFAMDTGNGSSTIPSFDSNFVVDYALTKEPASSVEWYATARLTGDGNLHTNAVTDENSNNNWTWDSQSGWGSSNGLQSNDQSWMWKRHAGFDVVTYKGNSTAGRVIPHNLGQVPEMIWVKSRNFSNQNWRVYHKGFNGGVNPWNYYMGLDQTSSASAATQFWNDTAPTSINMTLGNSAEANHISSEYVMQLFASVNGICKVGSYLGNGSTSGPTITTGFSPRFLIIKWIDGSDNWFVFDTLRGISSGNDYSLYLNSINAQQSHMNWLSVSSTGFTITSSDSGVNSGTGNNNYLYYAHA